jgi:hypothetical protein
VRVTHPQRLLDDRARARLTLSRNAIGDGPARRADLRELLDLLGLWPDQDEEATADPWPLPTERQPGTCITRHR